MMSLYTECVLTSMVMGLSIGIDAALVTLLRAKILYQTNKVGVWVSGVSLTHTLFPMAGYLLAYFGLHLYPSLTPAMGAMAFALIVHFIYSELQPITCASTPSLTPQYNLASLGLILAVSWDALWSGPAKSSQALHWPELVIWLSFIVVGLVVLLLTVTALKLGKSMMSANCDKQHTKIQAIAQWLQLSTISYFGWLALCRYTLHLQINWPSLLIFSCVSMALVLYCLHQLTTKNTNYKNFPQPLLPQQNKSPVN